MCSEGKSVASSLPLHSTVQATAQPHQPNFCQTRWPSACRLKAFDPRLILWSCDVLSVDDRWCLWAAPEDCCPSIHPHTNVSVCKCPRPPPHHLLRETESLQLPVGHFSRAQPWLWIKTGREGTSWFAQLAVGTSDSVTAGNFRNERLLVLQEV